MRGEVLVIIPTYNERENLPRILPDVLARDPAYDVLVVDDGSPDGTGEMADELAARPEFMREGRSRIQVLHRARKDGLGRAYLAGFRIGIAEGYPHMVQMDADLSHPSASLPLLVAAAREPEGADLVVGSRYVDGRVTVINWPIGRLLISLFGSAYARVITGLPIRDCTGGFNCYRREVLEAIDLDRVESNGYSFQIEMKFRSWKKGFRLREIPIVFTERDSGESKMSKRIVREAIWRVWKLRLLAIAGRL